MSTRAQVIVKDQYSEIWFYRHSDGYPEGVAPTLDKFCEMIKSKEIRNNAKQACGWLVIIGHEEYAESRKQYEFCRWKVGAYEPCAPKRHGDIEHLYEVDATTGTWKERTE